jgi:hypothetical protein
MAHATTVSFAESGIIDGGIKNDSHSSGITWSAVIAGAFASAALSLILLSLGTGLGFSAISPWSNSGLSAATISKGAILWLILMQAIGSLMGGYLAGRLRTKWTKIHSDEVYFRDTAHGFLVWAVGLVITAAFLASAAASLAGGNGHVGVAERAAGSSNVEPGVSVSNPNEYFVDALLRSNPPSLGANEAALRGEVSLIFANALRLGEIPAPDKTYLDDVVAARTGMKSAEADSRVTQVFAEAQQAADTARKAIAHLSLWMFLALLIGAFCASLAATFGGAQRDHVVIV